MPTFRAVIVAAVSDPHQATADKASLPDQLAISRNICEQRGWRVVETITIPGHSRRYVYLDELTADCPEFAHLVRLIRTEAVNLVVVRHYDRLWRTMELQQAVMAVCREHRCQVYAVLQPIEPLDPEHVRPKAIDKFIDSIHGFQAEDDNEKRSERVIVGLQGRVARGLHGCNGHPPYGYQFQDKRLVPAPGEAVWLRWIYERRAEGWSYPAICQGLNEQGIRPRYGAAWGTSTVAGLLRNRHVIGQSHWGAAVNEHASHEALIPRDLWDRAQRATALRTRLMPRDTKALSGLCRCALCGHAMIYNTHSGRRNWDILNCATYTRTGGKSCASNIHRALQVEAYVLDHVLQAQRDPTAHLAARAAQRDDQAPRIAAQLQQEIAAKQRQIDRWKSAYAREAIDLQELVTYRDTLTHEIRALTAELSRHTADQQRADNVLSLLQTTASLDLTALPPPDQRTIYLQLLHHITLTRGQPPQITWL